MQRIKNKTMINKRPWLHLRLTGRHDDRHRAHDPACKRREAGDGESYVTDPTTDELTCESFEGCKE